VDTTPEPRTMALLIGLGLDDAAWGEQLAKSLGHAGGAADDALATSLMQEKGVPAADITPELLQKVKSPALYASIEDSIAVLREAIEHPDLGEYIA
jgi:hypothetical protein